MTPQKNKAEPALRTYSHIFINSNEPGLFDSGEGGQHKVILQALNRPLTYGSGEDQQDFFYGVENFAGTEAAWDVTPVIFQEMAIHPDLAEFSQDPEKTLKKIQGRRAGSLKKSLVIGGPGQPRLESYIKFTDPDVEKLYNAGELGLSTALYCRTSGPRLDGKVRPNHVLLFDLKKARPRDLGSMFLNSIFLETNEPQEGFSIEKLDKILSDFTNSIKNLAGGNGGGDGEGDGGQGGPGGNGGGDGGQGGPGGNGGDQGQALANALAIKDQENKALQNKLSETEKALKNAQEDLKKFQEAEADRAWTALKNSTIPPGLIKTKEEEAALRQLYNSDRDGFYQKLLATKAKAPQGGREGEGFTNSEKFEKQKEISDKWDHLTGASIILGGK